MKISKVRIVNFKKFKDEFVFELNDGINILVGDNNSGKSTVLEAVHLALTGVYNGRYIKNDITQYIFNNDVVEQYIKKVKKVVMILIAI